MKITCLLLFVLLVACSAKEKKPVTISVIPKPNQTEVANGYLKLKHRIDVYTNSPDLQQVVQLFRTQVSNRLSIQDSKEKDAELILHLEKTNDNDESYRLETTKNKNNIRVFTVPFEQRI